MAVLHIHDEAAVRLRSFAKDDAAAPGRGRSSSVQCHVVNLFAAPGAQHPILVELDPLASKSGESLATSLNNVFLPLAALARRGVDAVAADARIFLVHIVVCDAVSANEKAARILLARHTSVAPAAEVHYFLMMVKCANHQTNLVVHSAVDGFAAKIGARQAATSLAPGAADSMPERNASNDAKTAPHRLACGAIVRLFKYLINAYYSEFYASLVAHCETLRIIVYDDLAAQRDAAKEDLKAAALEELYGDGVFPKGLRKVLNAGF